MEGGNAKILTFLIHFEETIQHIVYAKWEEEKMKMIQEGNDIANDFFIEFYTGRGNLEEKVQYVRKWAKTENKSHPHPNKMTRRKDLMLHIDLILK